MPRRRSLGARVSRLLYRALLAFYPRAFRDRFGDRMLDDFTRMYEARSRTDGGGGWPACGAWSRSIR